jgi:hypothetical protein
MSDFNDKSFKEGMRELLINALENGGCSTFEDTKVTLQDDTQVIFDIIIKVKEVVVG